MSNIKSEQKNQSAAINTAEGVADLDVSGAEEIKGGPRKIFIGGLSAADSQTSLSDLEAKEDVTGGEHILLARQVGVPSLP